MKKQLGFAFLLLTIGTLGGILLGGPSLNARLSESESEWPLTGNQLSIHNAPFLDFYEAVPPFPSFDREKREAQAIQKCANEMQNALLGLKQARLMILKTVPCGPTSSDSNGVVIGGSVYFLPLITTEK